MLSFWRDPNYDHCKRHRSTIKKILTFKDFVSLDTETFRELSFLFLLLKKQTDFLATLTLTERQQAKIQRLKNTQDFLRVSSLYHNFHDQNEDITMKPTDVGNSLSSTSTHGFNEAYGRWGQTFQELTSEKNMPSFQNIVSLSNQDRTTLLRLFKECKEQEKEATKLAKENDRKIIDDLIKNANYILIDQCISAWNDTIKPNPIEDDQTTLKSQTINPESGSQEHQDPPSLLIPSSLSEEKPDNQQNSPANFWSPTSYEPSVSIDFSEIKFRLSTVYDKLIELKQSIDFKFNKNQALYSGLHDVFQPQNLLEQLEQTLSLDESHQGITEKLEKLLPNIVAFVNNTELNSVINTPRPQLAIQKYTLVNTFCQLLKALGGIIATVIYPAAAMVKYTRNDVTPVFSDGIYNTFFSQVPASARKLQDIRNETDVLNSGFAQRRTT